MVSFQHLSARVLRALAIAAAFPSFEFLVHELSHGLIGAFMGLRPKTLIITPNGGYIALRGTVDAAWKEYAVALAGPVGSLVAAAFALSWASRMSVGVEVLPPVVLIVFISVHASLFLPGNDLSIVRERLRKQSAEE